jgi:hypothetical protein
MRRDEVVLGRVCGCETGREGEEEKAVMGLGRD